MQTMPKGATFFFTHKGYRHSGIVSGIAHNYGTEAEPDWYIEFHGSDGLGGYMKQRIDGVTEVTPSLSCDDHGAFDPAEEDGACPDCRRIRDSLPSPAASDKHHLSDLDLQYMNEAELKAHLQDAIKYAEQRDTDGAWAYVRNVQRYLSATENWND